MRHSFDFDPRCGFDRPALERVAPPADEPADFDAFWRRLRAEAEVDRVEILRRKPLWSPKPHHRIEAVYFRGTDGVEIGGWLATPPEPRGVLLLCHGYGNPAEPRLEESWTVFAPCLRGMGLSQCAGYPWLPAEHVLCGITDRRRYVLGGCAADLWRALTVLLELAPEPAAGNVLYRGGSFGGGMGALALPWEDRVHAARLDVPTFGHHRLRARFRSTGSGEAVRRHAESHPECFETLRYFDAATAAKRLAIPTLVTPALFDPCVVPPGQFAVANAVPERFRQTVIFPAGHFPTPENVDAELEAECRWAGLTAPGRRQKILSAVQE